MKNIIYILLMVFLAGNVLSAQQLGIKGGLNFTNVSSEKDLNLRTSNGFHTGLAFKVPLLFPMAIGTDLYYT